MIYLDLRPAHRLWTCLDVPEAPTDQAKRLCATPWSSQALSGSLVSVARPICPRAVGALVIAAYGATVIRLIDGARKAPSSENPWLIASPDCELVDIPEVTSG